MPVLEVKELRKRFGKNEVLRGISFDMERGEVVSILGPSGGGKTTLLRCLNFLEFADSGEICLDGNTLFSATQKRTEAQTRQNRLHFGLVFQSFHLFPQYTVLENVTLAPTMLKRGTAEEIRRKAHRLLAQVGLSDKENHYPYQLSGGQQQRVAIARALALGPEILCFDEPTSALDPELTGEVLRVIRSLREQGRTMIMVTHELEFARSVSDRIIFMADGIVVESGEPEALFTQAKTEKLQQFLQQKVY